MPAQRSNQIVNQGMDKEISDDKNPGAEESKKPVL